MTYDDDYDYDYDDYYPIDSPLSFSDEEINGFYDNSTVYLPARPTIGILDPMNRQMLMMLLFVFFVGGIMTFIYTTSNSGEGGQPQPQAVTIQEQQPQSQALQGAAVAAVPFQGNIASIFTNEVKYWESRIVEWGQLYGVDPNIVATVMQIESCGDPKAISSAGAQSLFQVMPFHFVAGENSMDPDTNAKRGMIFMADLLTRSNGDVGLALAGYNGGPGVMSRSMSTWPAETQRYYQWGNGIYSEISSGQATSETLNQWLAAGGSALCNQAAARLGL